MLTEAPSDGLARYLGLLFLTTALAVGLSLTVGWRYYDWPKSSAVFAGLVAALSFLFSGGDAPIRNLCRAFLLYAVACVLMVIVAGVYWDGSPLLIDLLAGPFERIGYFPGGDAWFPASMLIWGVSAFLITITAFMLGLFLKRITRSG